MLLDLGPAPTVGVIQTVQKMDQVLMGCDALDGGVQHASCSSTVTYMSPTGGI
jgi:hypothetical protein